MAVKVREWKGAWWVKVDYKGRRKSKRVGPGKEGKRAALAAAEVISAKLALGEVSLLDGAAPSPPTLREYAEAWLRSEAALRVKPITAERYADQLRHHILPALGDTPLRELTRAAIKAQIARWLREGKVRGGPGPLRPGTVRLLIATLRALLNAAVEDGHVTGNPAARLGRYVRADRLEEAPDPFTADEVRCLLEVAMREWPEWHAFFLTLARTGLRIGEGLALRRDDVDLGQWRVCVRQTWTRGRLGTAKGGRRRTVDLSPQAAETLRTWLSVQETEAAVQGRAPAPWLFPAPAGTPWDDRWVRARVWRPLLRRAGLRYRGPHQLRHSYASQLIAAGAHPKYIQVQMGHASIQVTMDVYGTLFPGAFARLVDALDGAPVRNPGATPDGVLAGITNGDH
jgi:integrase